MTYVEKGGRHCLSQPRKKNLSRDEEEAGRGGEREKKSTSDLIFVPRPPQKKDCTVRLKGHKVKLAVERCYAFDTCRLEDNPSSSVHTYMRGVSGISLLLQMVTLSLSLVNV